MSTKWHYIDDTQAKYLGIIEFQSDDGEYHTFEVMYTETHILFGGATNIGFLQSGYMEIDQGFTLDENLQELISDLEVYYSDGKQYVSRIVCNERM